MEIVTLRQRPDLAEGMWALVEVWPEFMLWDPMGDLYYPDVQQVWSDFALLAVEKDRVAARAFMVPFSTSTDLEREVLPPGGWDTAIRWGHRDRVADRETDTVAGLEVAIHPEFRGSGLAAQMVNSMKDNAERLGFNRLVIPVRPSRKHLEPSTSMAEYAGRVQADGLPADPWLRVHARAGGSIVGVCPTSMTIAGTLDEWRRWTGLPFDTSGLQSVEGALVPVHVSVEQDHAVYIEPNVWVEYSW